MIHFKKLTTISSTLIFFTTIYGILNSSRSYYMMGYSAIPWYIFSAIFFFIPFSFMILEFASAFRNGKGGMYTWLSESISHKSSFIIVFMYVLANTIWLALLSTGFYSSVSSFLFGEDITEKWTLFGLSSGKTLALLGIIFIIGITFLITRGMSKLILLASIGGIFVILLNFVILFISIIIFMLNGELAQPLSSHLFLTSPNHDHVSIISILSFFVFTIFSFVGIEAVCSLDVIQDNQEYKISKRLVLPILYISFSYPIGIFLWGISSNMTDILSNNNIDYFNIPYILMSNLGYELGMSLGYSIDTATTIGLYFSRFMGLSMIISTIGVILVFLYAPLKMLVLGPPEGIWHAKITSLNKHGMPSVALWIQCIIIIIFICMDALLGKYANHYFNTMSTMLSVTSTLPFIFIALAFPAFKVRKDLQRPFIAFKSPVLVICTSVIVASIIGFGNMYTVFEPALYGDYMTTILMIIGPAIFAYIATLYWNYASKNVDI